MEEYESVPVFPESVQPLVLEPDVVVVGDAVYADDAAVRVLVQQPPCETGADEACGSGHKYGRAVELYIFFQHLFRVYDSLRRSVYSTRLSAIVSNLKIVLPSIRSSRRSKGHAAH